LRKVLSDKRQMFKRYAVLCFPLLEALFAAARICKLCSIIKK